MSSSPNYPIEVFAGAETALFLFGAGFMGENDARYAPPGLRGTVVDIDASKLSQMRGLYPRDWSFVVADAYAYAEQAHADSFDVVSVDPFSSEFARCLVNLDLWLRVARKAVVLGTAPNGAIPYCHPPDWLVETVKRSPSADWTVYTR